MKNNTDRTDTSIVLVDDGCIIDPKAIITPVSAIHNKKIDRCWVISINDKTAYCHHKNDFFYVDIKYLKTIVRLRAFNIF